MDILHLSLAGATNDGVRNFLELLYTGRTYFQDKRQKEEVEEVFFLVSCDMPRDVSSL